LIHEKAMTVYLQASFEVIWPRVAAIEIRPLVAGRSRDQLEALLEQRRSRYEEADHTVDADRSLDEVASEVLHLWSA
jgi:shikimate kinase